MSDKFRIHKIPEVIRTGFPWAMDYPDGFSDASGPIGVACSSFGFAVDAFIKASDCQCPTCGRGAVVGTEWGWECTACGAHDVAVGCDKP